MRCLPFIITGITISCKRFSQTICLSKLSYKQDPKVLKGHPTLRSTCGRPPRGDIRRAPQSFRAATTVTTVDLGPGCIQSYRPHKKGLDHWGRKKGLRDNTRAPEKNTTNILETQQPYMQPFSRALVLLSERRFYVTTIQLMLTSPYSP